MSVLYLVATPIGNMEDITLRALRILRAVDVIACEDTRRARKLFQRYDIRTGFTSFYARNEKEKTPYLIRLLKTGKDIALISDSGTPVLSDPGRFLVQEALRQGIQVSSIPGPCALASALAVSGMPCGTFTFLGFLPRKEGKKRKVLQTYLSSGQTVVIYESPHRVLSTLQLLNKEFSPLEVVVVREMTKKFEQILRGTPEEIINRINPFPKGEIVLVARLMS